jgi:hypothetical protein
MSTGIREIAFALRLHLTLGTEPTFAAGLEKYFVRYCEGENYPVIMAAL